MPLRCAQELTEGRGICHLFQSEGLTRNGKKVDKNPVPLSTSRRALWVLEVNGGGGEGEQECDGRDRHSVTFSSKTVTEYLSRGHIPALRGGIWRFYQTPDHYELRTKPGSRGSWFCSLIFFLHGGLAAFAAVGTIGGAVWRRLRQLGQ